MSESFLQFVQQDRHAPDLIYVPNNFSVYFTRPGLATDSPSDSIFYGYDPITNLRQYDLRRELPAGTVLHELARGIYAGWYKRPRERPWERWSPPDFQQPITHQQPATHAGFSHGQTFGSHQQDHRNPEYVSPRLWNMFKTDDLHSRQKSIITREPIRTGQPHHADPSRAHSSKERPKAVHSRVPSYVSGEMTTQPRPAYKALMDGLNQFYAHDLKANLGHHFDDVDDDVIIAYAKAHVALFGRPFPELAMTVGEVANRGRHPSCLIPIPYLGIRFKYLDVILPLSQQYVRHHVDNDVLRLVHVHLAAFDRGEPDNAPMRASHADMAESRHRVLCELQRRGFTERMPNIVRLQGLGASTQTFGTEQRLKSRSILRSFARPTAFTTQPNQTTQTGPVGRARVSTNSSHDKLRSNARRHPQSSWADGSTETLLENKEKIPIKQVNEAGSPTRLHGNVTPSTSVQTVHDESVSELDLSQPSKESSHEVVTTKSEVEKLYDKEGPGWYITFGDIPGRIPVRRTRVRNSSEAVDLCDKEGPGSYVTFGEKFTSTCAADGAETDDPAARRMNSATNGARIVSDNQTNRPREHVHQGLDVPQKGHFDQPSPAKKRKVPVEEIQDIEMSDRSEGVITPSTSVQTVHEESALDPSNFVSAREACASRALSSRREYR